ncbi:MAG: signal peptidase I [Clostridia bacterium]|nr:signal peptidase I [Clostridia bacterium]
MSEQTINEVTDEMTGKKKEKKKKTVGQEILEWVLTILVAVIAALAIRSFVFEPVRVDGHSMDNTLADGEIMFVSKLNYGSVWLSLPWQEDEVKEAQPRLAFFGDPERFDIVICRYPGRGDTNFVKRVIGLPGDTVEVSEGKLYINGVMYEEPFISDEYRTRGASDGSTFAPNRVPAKGDVIEYRDGIIYLNGEEFPAGIRYFGVLKQNRRVQIYNGQLLVEEEAGIVSAVTENTTLTIENDDYLVMGDHRNNSNDSRSQGAISRDMIVGKVCSVVFPFNAWRNVQAPAEDRAAAE